MHPGPSMRPVYPGGAGLARPGKSLRLIRNHVKPLRKKYSSSVFRNCVVLFALPVSAWRGVWPIATNDGAGCDGRTGRARRARPVRTAKPCGPDLPTLGSSLLETASAGDGG